MAAGESTQAPSRRGWGPGLFIWPLLLFLLYVLSVGPVARWCPSPPPKGVQLFYAPLGYAYAHLEPVKGFFDWYAELWGTSI